MIAAVHHDQLAIETVLGAKGIACWGDRLERVLVRPRRQDDELLAHVALRVDAIGHEAVQHDHVVGARQHPAVQPLEQSHQ